VATEVHRPRLSRWELGTLFLLLEENYRKDRMAILWSKREIKEGRRQDSLHFPLAERQKALKKLSRLRRKIEKLLK
jgi:hypothetical protein